MTGDPSPAATEGSRRELATWLLAAILLAGLAVRLYAAWQARVIMDPDAGVVALMAKHMAEGRGIPVFFYGQPYMGSLEPAISALLCRLFGTSGFMVVLGTALTSFLLLPVMYLWGREVAGRNAGIAAAAFCILCTRDSFHYMINPRGGYAALVVLTAALLWQTPRLAWRTRQGDVPKRALFGLGLLAGLAWWVHQLSMEVLASCALLFLLVAGRRLFRARVLLPALAGFFLGSAPFWIWNLAHEGETFRFLAGAGHAGTAATLTDYLVRGRRWAGVESASKPLLLLIFAGYAVVLGWSGVQLLRAAARRAWSERDAHIASALLLVASSYFFFVHSSLSLSATARYLVPLVPAVALLTGVVAAEGRRWQRFAWVAGIPLLLVALPALPVLRMYSTRAAEGAAFLARGQELAQALLATGTRDAFSHFRVHAFNFALDEQIRFLQPENEHCLPYARQAESARQIAVLNNHGGAREFLRACGGAARQDVAAHMRFLHSFQAPSNALAEIPPDRWITEESARLTDGRLETAWAFTQDAITSNALEIVFTPPCSVASIRLLAREGKAYPSRWRMDMQSEPGGPWTILFPETPITAFFWSGPRPYNHGRTYRLQAHFEPRTASSLRIVFPPSSGIRTCVVSEVTCFGPGAPAPDEESAAARLVSVLRETGVRRLYSDRWIAQAVRTATAGAVATEVQPLWLDPGWRDTCSHLTLAAGVALLARSEDAPACRRVLARHGVTMDETPVPPWTLMQFRAAAAGPVTNLVWLGPVCAER